MLSFGAKTTFLIGSALLSPKLVVQRPNHLYCVGGETCSRLCCDLNSTSAYCGRLQGKRHHGREGEAANRHSVAGDVDLAERARNRGAAGN